MHAEVVLRSNQADILAYLVRRVENREDAADLFGDTYLVAWRKRRSMPSDPEAARKWLFVVARNTLLNHFRTRRRRHSLTQSLRNELMREEALDHDTTAEQLEVRAAIRALDDRQSELIRLVHWDGWSITDAADIMGISASTARSRYSAARVKLQKLLALNAA